MAIESSLERAKKHLACAENFYSVHGGDSLRFAEVTGIIALAEQVKRVADAQWKKLGRENKTEKE